MGIPPLRKLLVHYIAPRYPIKPTSLFVGATLRCSSRCVHCLVWAEGGRKKIELAPAEWRRIFSDPFFSAIHTFWLSGGEPTMRDDLHEIACAAIESMTSIESITLATNALDPAAIEKTLRILMPQLKMRGIYSHLHLSLDGPPEIHDRIRGVPGTFRSIERTVQEAQKLRDEGLMIGWSFNCVIQDDNADYLGETIDTANKLGGNITFNIADVRESFYRSREGREIGEAERIKILQFIEKLLENSDPYHRRHYETLRAILQGRPRPYRCETLEATIYLDPDASIYPCPQAYRAVDIRLTETAAEKAWKDVFRERARIRRELCPSCGLGCSFGEGLSLTEYTQLLLNM
jgi:MoaA/NifB/PqqE/SkfB family radical SAM enzyme